MFTIGCGQSLAKRWLASAHNKSFFAGNLGEVKWLKLRSNGKNAHQKGRKDLAAIMNEPHAPYAARVAAAEGPARVAFARKARGVRFGRPRTLTPHQRQEAMQRLAEGEVQADLARSYGVSQSTISRLSGDRPFPGDASRVTLQ
jgi:hypothetical protein